MKLDKKCVMQRRVKKNPFYGKHLSDETKKKMSESHKAYLKKKIDELTQ